ncbi:MAG: C39 family peptidase [Methylobacter sp.]|uniref:C39 family peptidase n=1 Tax=Methylobacter sp. TaxID=2051955 RepID=UPI002585C877|nr:C39 family peptidase [Methylobacter sp.]MCL7422660.1 C39 family peptidase [Methylobacter sp.]
MEIILLEIKMPIFTYKKDSYCLFGHGFSLVSILKRFCSRLTSEKPIISGITGMQKLMTLTWRDFLTAKKLGLLLCLIGSYPGISPARSVKSLIEMRHENVVIQQWDLSCGAATLTTLLNYQHGDPVTEKEVAKALMSRDEYIKNPGLVNIRQGFSLLDLKRYADAHGYKGMGYGKLTLDDLIKKAPIIVPISIMGYNHFVIFRGIQGNRVLLADPAWGNRTMLVDMFEKMRIDFPKIGKVGFVITRLDGAEPPNRLKPESREFVMTR